MFSTIKFKKYLIASIAIILSITCLPAFANNGANNGVTNDAMLDLLKILVNKGSLTQEEYDLLITTAKADEEKVEGSINEMKAEVAQKTKDLPKVTTKGKIKIEAADGSWAFQPIGRVFWDNIWSDDDDSASTDSGSELRRARLGFQATFMKQFKSKLELDFAKSGTPSWKDVWISYNGKSSAGKYWIKVGQSHVPIGRATISSSKYMAFMRRPLFADGPQLSRAVGIAARHDSKRWFIHAGVFRPAITTGNDEIGDKAGTTDAIHTAVRIGGTPFFQDKKHLIHTSVSYLRTNNNGDSVNYLDNALVSHIGSSSLEANFGTNTNSLDVFDVEGIAVWGPLHVNAEYMNWSVDDPDGDANLSAWAVDVGYFLTGESMKYKKGAFSGIGPNKAVGKGGIGAWQVAARIQNMDLNDGATINGGEADHLTIGLNWIPVKNVRFMANYEKVLDFNCANPGTDTLSGNCRTGANGTEPSSFSLRAQVYW